MAFTRTKFLCGMKGMVFRVGLDRLALWDVVRKRWWILPVAITTSMLFVWIQESDLRTDPGGYFVYRTYEARDATDLLSAVGVNPVSIRPFPDTAAQLEILRSDKVRQEIANEIGFDPNVAVKRTEPTFALVDTQGVDGVRSSIYQEAVPLFTFSCSEAQKANCDVAIDAFVSRASEIRRNAFTNSLTELRDVLQALPTEIQSPTVLTQLSAIDTLLERLNTPLALVSESAIATGPTIVSVRRPSLLFGSGAGLLIGLLVLLQMTYSDRKVRSSRSLATVLKPDSILGELSETPMPVSENKIALLIARRCEFAEHQKLRFIPISQANIPLRALRRLAQQTGYSMTVSNPFCELGPDEFRTSSPSWVDVLVVVRHRDEKNIAGDVSRALTLISSRYAGAVLLTV